MPARQRSAGPTACGYTTPACTVRHRVPPAAGARATSSRAVTTRAAARLRSRATPDTSAGLAAERDLHAAHAAGGVAAGVRDTLTGRDLAGVRAQRRHPRRASRADRPPATPTGGWLGQTRGSEARVIARAARVLAAAVIALGAAGDAELVAGRPPRHACSQPASDAHRAAPPAAAARLRATADARRGRRPQRLYWGAWIGSQLTGAEAPWDYERGDALRAAHGQGGLARELREPLRELHRASRAASYHVPAQRPSRRSAPTARSPSSPGPLHRCRVAPLEPGFTPAGRERRALRLLHHALGNRGAQHGATRSSCASTGR